jgi:hypothetical protein
LLGSDTQQTRAISRVLPADGFKLDDKHFRTLDRCVRAFYREVYDPEHELCLMLAFRNREAFVCDTWGMRYAYEIRNITEGIAAIGGTISGFVTVSV